ncbi:hypothetical protein [Pseudoduganella aquatica]|uniref:Uncharacterized protein n=1 Tax=Pseudoduganella aquatica TaxID=2660641 RepID=A0A7X4KPV4_9BURK|nr:hypothetical protein [Pseudoduganella aquatica]MYN10285.1 hypothetical protein [Pseudoduganella aquatica]
MNDDDEEAALPEPFPAWCVPRRAKDMLHGSALFVRDMLAHDHDGLYQMYGIRPEEAAQSLHYVELAALRAWGIDEMLEAVAAVPNQASGDAALRRRIAMAMKSEAAPDFIHPGDAVLLLERSGLMLADELRDAVVRTSLHFSGPDGFSLDDENRFRRLHGKTPFPNAVEPPIKDIESGFLPLSSDEVRPSDKAPEQSIVHRTRNRVRLLDAEILRAKVVAGTNDHHAVWTALKEMALQSISPFTGEVDGEKGLAYSKEKGIGYLSKDALRKRMAKEGDDG